MNRQFQQLVAVPVLATLIVGCQARATQKQAPEPQHNDPLPLVLRSYDVPAGQAQQTESVLSSVLSGTKNDEITARVEISPNGQLLVLGPPGVHRGVTDFLDKMAQRKPLPPPPTIEMQYWLGVGQRADQTELGSGLDAVAPALETIAGAQGPMRFDKLESMRLRSLSDERGEANGMYVIVGQRASITEGTILSDIEVSTLGGSRLETRLSLQAEKTVVLGEAGIDMARFKPSPVPGAGPFTLFYIVRAAVRNAG